MFQSFQPFQSVRPFGPSNVQGSTFQDIGQIRSRTAGRTSHSIRAERDLTVATGNKPGLGCQAFPNLHFPVSMHTHGIIPHSESSHRERLLPPPFCRIVENRGYLC